MAPSTSPTKIQTNTTSTGRNTTDGTSNDSTKNRVEPSIKSIIQELRSAISRPLYTEIAIANGTSIQQQKKTKKQSSSTKISSANHPLVCNDEAENDDDTNVSTKSWCEVLQIQIQCFIVRM